MVQMVISWMLDPKDVPGWSTTDINNQIEIWATPLYRAVSHNGRFICELNANSPASVYQNLSTDSGSLYRWSFWHRARYGGMEYAGALINGDKAFDIDNQFEFIADSTVRYLTYHEGYFATPPSLSITRVEFKAYSKKPYDSDVAGNLIDGCDWVKIASPVNNTIYLGDSAPDDNSLVTSLLQGYSANVVQPVDFSTIGKNNIYRYYGYQK
ncbi:hypothetical protein AZF37_00510 [endosymbiont 'TC1' of Trimyema compressum]|uniref:hypothetical protein n=1 Tax=endosymbiont 'TC1' of Trimyema compressum TaxID=243899 RepID=UPI0007F0E6C9|nr:hypothetical protein [endosymbiont 'TC1' of Trimyema compressum]AMP19860.1 hypothetical protein AZF37_00510 [endosymbiont 'TC1' of Trimyema compressum]